MNTARVVLPDGLSGRPVTAQIESEFPGVCAWYGKATEAWWAMVRVHGVPRLVEAPNPQELRNAIIHLRGWSWPH
ncbi:hypothetical protein GCM10009727_20630 [Actinomadura napierensis]|uniref:Uncharacterized protein n=1 Tax=Actinomadura napierensis TaxID=267854 RepID=A0ABP5KDJ8_9ACTN